MKSKLWMVCCNKDDPYHGCDKYLILENPKHNCLDQFDSVIRILNLGYLKSRSHLRRTKENSLKNIDDTCKKCKYGLRFVFNKCKHTHTFTEFKESPNER